MRMEKTQRKKWATAFKYAALKKVLRLLGSIVLGLIITAVLFGILFVVVVTFPISLAAFVFIGLTIFIYQELSPSKEGKAERDEKI